MEANGRLAGRSAGFCLWKEGALDRLQAPLASEVEKIGNKQ